MRVVACTNDWYNQDVDEQGVPEVGGGGFYRCGLPLAAFRDAGHEAILAHELRSNKQGELEAQVWLGDEEGNDWVGGIDVLISQRWMNGEAEMWTRYARANGQIVIGDLDDWYWGMDQTNAAFYGTHPKLNPKLNREHYKRQLGACNAVFCSTAYLAERVRPWIKNTFVLRNMIDIDLWATHDVTATGDSPVVGWTGGTMWRTRDLSQLAGTVGVYVNEHRLRFAHVGHREDSTPLKDLLRLSDDIQISKTPQISFNQFPDAVAAAQIDIGLVAMDDSPFNRAKSCLKGMEYAAAGIPFIAPDFPEYRYLGIGILAARPLHWVKAMRRLHEPGARAELSAAGLERIQYEDYRVRGKEWLAAVESLM